MSVLTIDRVLDAAAQLGLKWTASEQIGSWRMACPLCVLSTEGQALTVTCSEPPLGSTDGEQPARIDCRNGCARGEILRHLRAAIGDSPEGVDGLVVRTADLALSRPPEWAWRDRIVLSALNLIVGQEGAGKGTLACWVFAKLTRGELPGSLHGEPVSVAIVGDEDGFDAVWTPRLHAANADLSRVKLIERGDGSLIELAADRERLAEAVNAFGVRLLYLDQLTDNLGAAVDDWRAKQVREALAPARQLARELNCAVLGSLHPNKSGASFRQLMSGSIAFNALSRSSLLLAEHPEDPDRRVVTRAKGNLSAVPEAVEFGITGHTFTANGHTFDVPRATGFSTSALTTEDLLSPASPAPVGDARAGAREMVAEALDDGDWHRASDLIARCEEQGVYKRAVQRAADDLGVEKAKRGYPARALWRLPQPETTPEMTALSSVASVAPVTSVASVEMALESRGDMNDTDDRGASVTSGVTTDPYAASVYGDAP
jgi:AAA domain